MKLDNKGITLVELIISVALISIVIIFLFRLLVDVRYNNHNTDFNLENQQTRAMIIKTIETDFLEKKLVGLSDSATNTLTSITFFYKDGTSGVLTIEEDKVSYTNPNGTEKWLLQKENDFTKIAFQCVTYRSSLSQPSLKENGEFFSVKINVPIIVSSTSKNTLDDLEFFYIGEKQDILNLDSAFPIKLSLGNYYEATCG